MKKVKYDGKIIEVNDYVSYVARDADGALYGYQYMPEKFDEMYEPECGQVHRIDEHWETSLQEVCEHITFEQGNFHWAKLEKDSQWQIVRVDHNNFGVILEGLLNQEIPDKWYKITRKIEKPTD